MAQQRAARKTSARKPASRPSRSPGVGSNPGSQPAFAQPEASPDPTSFVTQHPSDKTLYGLVPKGLLTAFPPLNSTPPVISLASALGDAGPARDNAIKQANQIVFHAAGDTGSTHGPESQSLVADKMAGDFHNEPAASQPAFLFHLGDVVYSFGEAKYYYDQFYEPYRNYPAPIFAIAGNHDGLTYSGDRVPSLDAFLRNFCARKLEKTPESGALVRTAMVEPGIYFTLEAPFVRIIGLFSNVLEDPGVLSSEGKAQSPVDDSQLEFLTAELKRCKSDAFKGAVLVALHHPPFTGGENHRGSPRLLQDLDQAAQQGGFWPHAYLSGHAHNYQRYTRTVNKLSIPYIVCGNGGHGLSRLSTTGRRPLRTPAQVSPDVTLASYFDQDYGYERIVVDGNKARFEFHIASPTQDYKTPSDVVTVDLASHQIVSN